MVLQCHPATITHQKNAFKKTKKKNDKWRKSFVMLKTKTKSSFHCFFFKGEGGVIPCRFKQQRLQQQKTLLLVSDHQSGARAPFPSFPTPSAYWLRRDKGKTGRGRGLFRLPPIPDRQKYRQTLKPTSAVAGRNAATVKGKKIERTGR